MDRGPSPVSEPGHPPVILVHGAVERGEGFSRVLPGLNELEIVTYDRRGHGSRWTEGSASLNEDIDELIELVGARVVTAVGHSLGGLVVLGAAIRQPRLFRSIGLYETSIPWGAWWTDSDRATMLEETERNASAVKEGPSERRARLEVAWESCHRQVLDALDAPYEWQDLKVPLATGRGALSQSNSARDATIVAEFFGADAMVLPESGHRAHWTNPDAFADFVRHCLI
jgi:pimeloyl-ACP methyl ester carboxylesterase